MNISHLTSIQTKYILDCDIELSKKDIDLWYWYGVNYQLSAKPPKITKVPELVIFRGSLLKKIAIENNIDSFVEIGTARGWQSILIADAFKKMKKKPRIITCDIHSHTEKIYLTPFTGEDKFSREELWSRNPELTKDIIFLHGTSDDLIKKVDRKLDMVYIDGMHNEEEVLRDYNNLEPCLSENAIIVFDDCDERFPGVKRAVLKIINKIPRAKIERVSFEPSEYKIIIIKLCDD